MSLIDVPSGQIAAIVTYLEMRERPADLVVPASSLSLERDTPAPDAYRHLFQAVGAPWLWFSRLVMPTESLGALLADPGIELFKVHDGPKVVGMLELDRRVRGECELAFVGLLPAYAGRGHGRWLLAEAVNRAWAMGTHRVHVHTCTLDHPAALRAYRRAGFIAVGRKVETFVDPRLMNILPAESAPQVPLIRSGIS